jgi:hypothetical protein
MTDALLTSSSKLFGLNRSARHACFALLLATICVGCANTTELSTTWREPSATGPLSFKKVVVVVLNSSPAERRAQEDELVSDIRRTPAVPSYVLVPDGDLADRELVKKAIVESGADGAVILRLIDARNEATYIPGTTSYWGSGGGYSMYRSPGSYVTNTIVRAEVSLYSVPDGKLLWAGSSTTTNPENAKDFAKQVSRAAAIELHEQGLLP